MKRILVLAAACAGLLGMSGGVFAVPVFSDNFDSDNAVTALNFAALLNWNVNDGTIDYIRSGGFGIGCVGGTGGCIDTDGSTGNSGRMTTKSAFSFGAGAEYTLSVDLSGNQRGGQDDSIKFGITDGVAELFLQTLTLDPSAPFATFSLPFTPSSSFTGRIFVEGLSNDNVGPILDNVLLDARQPQQVDEPSMISLLALLFAGLAALRRRAAS
jgi:hypothetical protein